MSDSNTRLVAISGRSIRVRFQSQPRANRPAARKSTPLRLGFIQGSRYGFRPASQYSILQPGQATNGSAHRGLRKCVFVGAGRERVCRPILSDGISVSRPGISPTAIRLKPNALADERRRTGPPRRSFTASNRAIKLLDHTGLNKSRPFGRADGRAVRTIIGKELRDGSFAGERRKISHCLHQATSADWIAIRSRNSFKKRELSSARETTASASRPHFYNNREYIERIVNALPPDKFSTGTTE